MTATIFHQPYMTQRPSLFTLISYCAIVFSFALMFANGWFTSCTVAILRGGWVGHGPPDFCLALPLAPQFFS